MSVQKDKTLSGKIALVTGGAGGLGRAIAALLLSRGATVIISDFNDARLAEAKAALSRDAGAVATTHVDNRDVAKIAKAIETLTREHGGIDILINNAGISGDGKPIEAIDETAFDAVFDTHVKGAFFFTQAVVGAMKARRWGRIVNISSHFALVGHDTMSHYSAAKSAMLGLTKSWAREFAPHGVTVNAIAPALLDTPMTRASIGEAEIAHRMKSVPIGRLASPREIAYAIGWLVSCEADMMTGQTVSPNGGLAIVGM